MLALFNCLIDLQYNSVSQKVRKKLIDVLYTLQDLIVKNKQYPSTIFEVKPNARKFS